MTLLPSCRRCEAALRRRHYRQYKPDGTHTPSLSTPRRCTQTPLHIVGAYRWQCLYRYLMMRSALSSSSESSLNTIARRISAAVASCRGVAKVEALARALRVLKADRADGCVDREELSTAESVADTRPSGSCGTPLAPAGGFDEAAAAQLRALVSGQDATRRQKNCCTTSACITRATSNRSHMLLTRGLGVAVRVIVQLQPCLPGGHGGGNLRHPQPRVYTHGEKHQCG